MMRAIDGRTFCDHLANLSMLRSRVLLLISLLALPLSDVLACEDWPQFRGLNCSGVSLSKKALPAQFSATENVVWSAHLGEGIGSPTVADGRVFSTAMEGETPEERRFVVSCFAAATGKLLWRREFDAGPEPLPPIVEVNSYASASAAADAERVYVYFTRIGLAALDTRDGNTVWQLKLPEPFFIFDWGPGMSPVLFKDMVFFCQDDDLSPALYAVDRATGRLIWKDDRSDMAVSYSHPVICETPQGPEIVVAGTGRLIGYDPRTGKRKWASELFCRNIKTSPVSHDGIVYVSVESTGISYQWRAVADANGDGKITREEIQQGRMKKDAPIPQEFWKKFERGDINGDGILEGEEIDRAFLDPTNQGGLLARDVQARGKGEKDVTKFDDEMQKEASIQAVRGGGSGDVSRTHVLWKRVNRAPDHVVSPLVVHGRILFVKSGGISNCFDAATGEPVWEKKRIGNEGGYLASPVYGDGKIYVAGQNGFVVVLQEGPELKVLSKNDMGESIIGTPAIADGRVYIRTRNKLYCVAN
jgi:outer membrane protein assembly factor BamB